MKNNKKKNFFTQSKKEFGENFFNYMNSRTLLCKSAQVFRELSRGQINVEDEGKYFLNPEFLQACLTTANSKLTLHTISRDGVVTLINTLASNNMPISNDMTAVQDFHTRAAEAYTLILNAMTYINTTRDVTVLSTILRQLSSYRNYI